MQDMHGRDDDIETEKETTHSLLLREPLSSPCFITGHSPAIETLRQKICKIAAFTFPVLIVGETGSGKELVARQLHAKSSAAESPFIAVNCGAITESLLISELFGYMKSSFTGARNDKAGIFLSAGKGTVFLDEIEAAPLSFQAALLRVIENREFLPVGAVRPVRFTGRIVAASNADLLDLCKKGGFRKDLYYRLSTVYINIPPLRQRPEDIPDIIKDFLSTNRLQSEEKIIFTDAAIRALCEYHWPGNVRELQNVIIQCLLESEHEIIDEKVVRKYIVPPHGSAHVAHTLSLREIEKKTVVDALKKCHGNKAKAAEIMGVCRSTLYSLLKKHQIHEL